MKLEIEGWAKISTIPYSEVVKMGMHEWIVPWFKSLGFNDKLILTGNTLSVITLIIMIFKKEFFLAKIQLIIIINLIFWLLMAPDVRFVYSFLLIGFSLTVSYFVKLMETTSFKSISVLVKIVLTCVFILVTGLRIIAPAETLKHPALWIVPAPFGSVATEVYETNFKFRVPVERGGCLNAEIPCVPYPFDNIVMRGSDIREGFRVDTTSSPGIHIID